ncbi:MAG TPA: hypothetical protein VFN87_04690 [Solirubrobacteraceae bacterium]|nr:hypothetical protein [Solirubrobacteraceae bacterium]
MTILAVVDTILLLVAIVYIVALLRSHADILRRLAVLEEARGGDRGGAGGRGTGAGAPPPVTISDGSTPTTAVPITGTTPAGDAVALSFGPGSPPTLLAFLTSGCSSCAPLWAGLRDAGEAEALADRVVVVSHDSTRESPTRIQRLAPSGVELVMSSSAWEAYAVPASPHFVLTDGEGGIRGRGSALSWSQLVTMIDDARADALAAAGAAGAETTAGRAERSARTLATAGIGPGHPSLYPGSAGSLYPPDDASRG